MVVAPHHPTSGVGPKWPSPNATTPADMLTWNNIGTKPLQIRPTASPTTNLNRRYFIPTPRKKNSSIPNPAQPLLQPCPKLTTPSAALAIVNVNQATLDVNLTEQMDLTFRRDADNTARQTFCVWVNNDKDELPTERTPTENLNYWGSAASTFPPDIKPTEPFRGRGILKTSQDWWICWNAGGCVGDTSCQSSDGPTTFVRLAENHDSIRRVNQWRSLAISRTPPSPRNKVHKITHLSANPPGCPVNLIDQLFQQRVAPARTTSIRFGLDAAGSGQ